MQIRNNLEANLLKQTQNNIGLKPRISKHINTITNRLLAVVKADSAKVALTEKNSLFLNGVNPKKTNTSLTKVFIKGAEVSNPEINSLNNTPFSEYIHLDPQSSASNSDSEGNLTFGLQAFEASSSSNNLTGSFHLVVDSTSDPLSDLFIEVVDSSGKVIGSLGTLEELSGGLIGTNQPKINSNKIDLPNEPVSNVGKIEYNENLVESNGISNVGAQIVKLTKNQSDEGNQQDADNIKYIVSLVVANPAQLDAATKATFKEIIDPNQFFSGELGFNIKNLGKTNQTLVPKAPHEPPSTKIN